MTRRSLALVVAAALAAPATARCEPQSRLQSSQATAVVQQLLNAAKHARTIQVATVRHTWRKPGAPSVSQSKYWVSAYRNSWRNEFTYTASRTHSVQTGIEIDDGQFAYVRQAARHWAKSQQNTDNPPLWFIIFGEPKGWRANRMRRVTVRGRPAWQVEVTVPNVNVGGSPVKGGAPGQRTPYAGYTTERRVLYIDMANHHLLRGEYRVAYTPMNGDPQLTYDVVDFTTVKLNAAVPDQLFAAPHGKRLWIADYTQPTPGAPTTDSHGRIVRPLRHPTGAQPQPPR